MSEPAEATRAADRPEPDPRIGTTVTAGLVAVALTALAVIALTGPVRGPDLRPPDPAATASLPEPGATTTSPGATTVPELPEVDGFDRADGPLGATDGDLRWTVEQGEVAIGDGRACAVAAPRGARAHLDARSPGDVGVAAVVDPVAPGSGLAVHAGGDAGQISVVVDDGADGWVLEVVDAAGAVEAVPVPQLEPTADAPLTVILGSGRVVVANDPAQAPQLLELPAAPPGGGDVALVAGPGAATCFDDVALQAGA